ncbi:hypothetical protein [Zooshikella ganghwensis]|uniref:hypothetical protein n=1 Tax=Zooshikella ganghwensis TaxID=202772 RepID=UPI000485324E|nr:hypothetical protein [Zooshikella ganghwensis]
MNKLSLPFSKIITYHHVRQFFLLPGRCWYLALICTLAFILIVLLALWGSHRDWLSSWYQPSLEELQDDYLTAHVYWVNCEARASIAFEMRGPKAAEQITRQPKCIMARQTTLQPQG